MPEQDFELSLAEIACEIPRREDQVGLHQDNDSSPLFPLLGRRVVINGLVAKPEHNGRTGSAVSFDEDAGRYSVELDDTSSSLVIKPCNLHSSLPQVVSSSSSEGECEDDDPAPASPFLVFSHATGRFAKF